jgi:hypothetical protein
MVGSALCVELTNRHSSRSIRPEIISGKAKRTMATHAVLPSTSLHIPSIFAMSFPLLKFATLRLRTSRYEEFLAQYFFQGDHFQEPTKSLS